jgi:hypothetical protein
MGRQRRPRIRFNAGLIMNGVREIRMDKASGREQSRWERKWTLGSVANDDGFKWSYTHDNHAD